MESLKLKLCGHQVHYLKAGSGPPVLLLHGGASDSRDWIKTMEALCDRYSLYAPDVIGYGQSERLKEGYYMSEFVQFVLEFIQELGLVSPALVGHSLGGSLCMQTALDYPERVRKLVLVDAAGFGEVSHVGSYMLTFFWAVRKVMQRRQPYPKYLTEEGKESDWFYLERLPELKVPTLIVWKRYDPYLPLALARKADELIPHSRLVVLPGFGHAPHKQDGNSFNRILLDFLAED